MEKLIQWLIKEYGILFVILFAFVFSASTWLFAHWNAAPGKEISILWGMVQYTKISNSISEECSNLLKVTEKEEQFIVGWGVKPPNIAKATIATNKLTKHANEYNMILICRINDNKIDLLEDTKILKSNLFSITSSRKTIEIEMPSDFIERLYAKSNTLQFQLSLIPKAISSDAIKKIGDIEHLGGIIFPEMNSVSGAARLNKGSK